MVTDLGVTHCRYCNTRLPGSSETIDVDGMTVTVRKPGRPRVCCGDPECVAAQKREYNRRYKARKAMWA